MMQNSVAILTTGLKGLVSFCETGNLSSDWIVRGHTRRVAVLRRWHDIFQRYSELQRGYK